MFGFRCLGIGCGHFVTSHSHDLGTLVLWQLIEDLAGKRFIFCQLRPGFLQVVCGLGLAVHAPALCLALGINAAGLRALQIFQRARRFAMWRGSFITLFLCTAWMLASAYADRITS